MPQPKYQKCALICKVSYGLTSNFLAGGGLQYEHGGTSRGFRRLSLCFSCRGLRVLSFGCCSWRFMGGLGIIIQYFRPRLLV